MSDELPGYDAWLTTPPDECDCDPDADEYCRVCDRARWDEEQADARAEAEYEWRKEEGLL